jgi:hypothetical protein
MARVFEADYTIRSRTGRSEMGGGGGLGCRVAGAKRRGARVD